MTEPDRYCVIGNPIAHSLSPQIHQSFAQQTGQSIQYDRKLAEPDQFDQTVSQFIRAGGRGMNVTVPFKEQAFALADESSPAAQVAGAVNTLVFEGGRIRGENTDGVGLVRDLQQRVQVSLAGAHIVLLGAGGAARGVVGPLAQAGVRTILVGNRTEARARQLVDDLQPSLQAMNLACQLTACALDALEAGLGDGLSTPSDNGAVIWLNSTTSSLQSDTLIAPPRWLGRAHAAYDLVYAAAPTAFMRAASDAGCNRVADGLGMLVEQAAESFWLWRGQRPDTEPVFELLRQQLNK